jgi:hypothetical protein
MPRRTIAPLVVVATLVLMAGRADAHATFVNPPSSVTPDTDVALTMNVPHERGSGPYNVAIAVGLPTGWRAVSCQSQATWSCVTGIEGTRTVIRYSKDAGAARAQDETFHFTVHTGTTLGTFAVPTVQTYSTGEQVAWIQDPTGAEPAPTLTVAGTAPPTTPTTTTAPATTAGPETTTTTSSKPDGTTTTVPAATTAELGSSTTTADSTTNSTVSTATTAPAPSTSETVTSVPASNGSSSSSGGAAAIVVIALALVAGAGVAVWAYRRRTD